MIEVQGNMSGDDKEADGGDSDEALWIVWSKICDLDMFTLS